MIQYKSKVEVWKMKEKNQKKKQIVKIAIFITSIFIIFISISYAFINQTLMGMKRQVITAGNLQLELKDENNVTIENAMPVYDEVGTQQEPFKFALRNNGNIAIDYKILLRRIENENELIESAVRYSLTKDGTSSVFTSTLADLMGQYDTNRVQLLPREEYREEALKFCQKTLIETEETITEEECVSTFSDMIGYEINSFDYIIRLNM